MRREESLHPPDWVRIAEKDLERVGRGLRDGDTQLAGVYLQQAVEKFLKAYLLARGWKLQRIHDLGRLVDEARAFDPELARFREVCQEITDYYLLERYPLPLESELTDQEVRASLEQVRGLIERIRGALG